MKQIGCEVINDLLPSYMEEICSAETTELVEEHLSTCENCNKKVKQMRRTVIVTDKAEGREIDNMKKVKQWMALRGQVSFWCFTILLTVVIAVIKNQYVAVPVEIFYVVLAIFAAGTNWMFREYADGKPRDRERGVLFGISIVMLGYQVVLYFMMKNPFRFEAERTGVFYNTQLTLVLVVQFVMFLFGMIQAVRRGGLHPEAIVLPLTSVFYSLAMQSLLGSMTDMETFLKAETRITLIMLGEGAVLMALMMIFNHRRLKKELKNKKKK